MGNQVIGRQINLTLYNSPPLVMGVSGQALDLIGINQYATIASAIHPCLKNPSDSLCREGFSIFFWVKVSSNQYGNVVHFMGHGCPNQGTGFCFIMVNGKFLWSANLVLQKHGASLDADIFYNVWTSMGITWSSATGMQVYVNGASILDHIPVIVRPTAISVIDSLFYFGWSGISVGHWAKFMIDEFYFWPDVKCADFMRVIYEYDRP